MSEHRPFPLAFTERMKAQLGDEYEAFLQSLFEEPPLSIRFNPLKPGPSQLKSDTPVNWCTGAYYLQQRPLFTLDPDFHAGRYYVQEASSMILEEVWKQLPDLPQEPLVLDACAAPGGKSTHLLSLMNGHGVLVANEPVSTRHQILRENLARWAYPNRVLVRENAARLKVLGPVIDLLMIDAPCSGEGLFRKNPEAADEWSYEASEGCAYRQKVLLNELIPLIKPGGYLLYSTCTFNPAENDEQMAGLKEAGFIRRELPIEKFGFQSSLYGYQAYPHRVKGEGFYISLWQNEKYTTTAGNAKTNSRYRISSPSDLGSWQNEFSCIETAAAQQFLFPTANLDSLKPILAAPFSLWPGLLLYEKSSAKAKPDHELAYLENSKSAWPAVDVNTTTALRFLKGESNLNLETDKGLHLVTYDAHALGWMNCISPGRNNNLLPKNYRIRMQLPSL